MKNNSKKSWLKNNFIYIIKKKMFVNSNHLFQIEFDEIEDAVIQNLKKYIINSIEKLSFKYSDCPFDKKFVGTVVLSLPCETMWQWVLFHVRKKK